MEEKLIVAVAGFPNLYDPSLLSYRDNDQRNSAWRRVAEIVGVPEDVCRTRWKSLRDQYTRDKRKERERNRSGAGASSAQPWRYMAVMGFLAPFLEARPTTSNLPRQVYPNTTPATLPSAAPTPLAAPTLLAAPTPLAAPTLLAAPTPADAPILLAAPTPPDAPTLLAAPTPPIREVAGDLEEAGPSTSDFRPQMRKKRAKAMSVFERELLNRLEEAGNEPSPPPTPPAALSSADEDKMFFLSLLPAIRRMSVAKRAEVKFKIYSLVYQADVEGRE
ncbi:classical arabinogalactan protein 9-like [Alosa sapidissima]|uniref:classical arabinogalactan protein 9-like n=1 Tax=Alosa sapidissima TaxID=34773 RepID=UPI001C0A4A0F|nr:classical arabinogalactan protein 9-like [Alosa sapidissima]